MLSLGTTSREADMHFGCNCDHAAGESYARSRFSRAKGLIENAHEWKRAVVTS